MSAPQPLRDALRAAAPLIAQALYLAAMIWVAWILR